jgi:hypothetical protein
LVPPAVQFASVERADGNYKIENHPSVKCFDEVWRTRIVAPAILLLFFTVVFPTHLMFVFWSNRREISQDYFVKPYGVFTTPYRREFFYWEFVVVLKRYLVVLLSLVDDDKKFAATIVLLFVFLYLELIVQPFSFGVNLLSTRLPFNNSCILQLNSLI